MAESLAMRVDPTSLIVASIGDEGEIFYNTDTRQLVSNDGVTVGGFHLPIMSYSFPSNGTVGSINNSSSGSGTDHNHNFGGFSGGVAANVLYPGRIVIVKAVFYLTTGSAAPNLITKLKAGSVVLAQNTAVTPPNSISNRSYSMEWVVQATQAPGAAANLLSSQVTSSIADGNTIAQPVAVATNASIVLIVATNWSAAGTGVNTVQLEQLSVEIKN